MPIEVRGGVGSMDVGARGSAMIGEVALDPSASLELPDVRPNASFRRGLLVYVS